MSDPGVRLHEILERSRAQIAPKLSSELLHEIAEIQETYRYDDDRRAARQQIRAAVTNAVNASVLDEEHP
jgi:hypothetical protein